MPIKHVCVLVAMDEEARPMIENLKLAPLASPHPKSPIDCYQGEINGVTFTVITNGKCSRFGVANVGTTPAALTAYLAITSLNPDIVINAGTAGGFQAKGGAVGDVYISTILKHHDRRIPIPGFTEYGTGTHTSIECPKLVEFLSCKTGVVSTGNSLDHTAKDDEMMLANDASVKEMEAAAIAWVAEMLSVPFFALKVITDIVDGDMATEEEFLQNLSTAAKQLQATVPKVVEFISKAESTDNL